MYKYEKEYTKLKEILLDLVAEEQAKLGYFKGAVRLYYPLSSLNHIFDSHLDVEGMLQALQEFSSYMQQTYGAVEISNKKERFCFNLSEKCSEYVHNHPQKSEFMCSLIQLVKHHDVTMEQVMELFSKEEKPYVVEQVNNGDFDVLIRFTTGEDAHYYCFKEEGCHMIYHRFLPEDYRDLYPEA